MIGSLVFKFAAATMAIGAARAVRTVARGGWRRATGSEPPDNPAHPDVGWTEALLWGVTVGALAGVGRIAARKLTTSAWHGATGNMPPDLRIHDDDATQAA